ncbi:MAG: hypothetical protein HN348_36260, partial [Proteobacteria bacterium]|nr:hypothetical protein [Pseudomonadota bacterium]
GDSSRRLSHGATDPQPYFDLFNKFHLRMSPVVIGPVYDREEFLFPCPTGAADWGTMRYDNLVRRYGGTYIDITDPDAGCNERDFAEALGELGELLKSLADAFPLQSIPIEETIIVQVDGKQIKQAEAYTDQYGEEVYDDGWSYRGIDNSIVLHGTAVPDYNADVQIYYRPMDGMPRELPF